MLIASIKCSSIFSPNAVQSQLIDDENGEDLTAVSHSRKRHYSFLVSR